MFCKFCGNQIDGENKFCSKCGANTGDNVVNTFNSNEATFCHNDQIKDNKSKKVLIIIIVAIIVLTLFIIGIINILYSSITERVNEIWNVNVNDNMNDNSSVNNSSKFVANNIKNYSSLGYMDYNVPDCWIYNESMSASMQYKSYVFTFKDNLSMLNVKAGSIMGNNNELEQYNYFKDQIINAYGNIQNEELKYFNNQKWYVFTTGLYDYPYGNSMFYNKIYLTFSNSASNIYYFEAYINNNMNEKEYIEDSVEYIINSANLYKLDN